MHSIRSRSRRIMKMATKKNDDNIMINTNNNNPGKLFLSLFLVLYLHSNIFVQISIDLINIYLCFIYLEFDYGVESDNLSLDIIYSDDSGSDYVPEKISTFHISDSDESFVCLENNQHKPETSTIMDNHNNYIVCLICAMVINFYCIS